MKIAREGLPIAAVSLLLAAAGGALLHPTVALPILAVAAFTLWFFRDPERHPPAQGDALISPADGRVIRAGPRVVSIFMNVFNVHVCRAPVAGVVESVRHTRGRFLAAFKEEASEHNERVSIVLGQGPRRVAFTLVAGLVAKHIVCRVAPGQHLVAGERVGLIRFGSRVDVHLPPGSRVAVSLGQKVLAGETSVARLPSVAGRLGRDPEPSETASVDAP